MVEPHPSRRRVVAALRDPFLSRTTPPGWKRTVSARPHGFRDIPVHVHKNGTAWAGMPGKRQLEDGHLKLDPNGKALYPAAVDWKDKALRDRFSAAVVELVRANHPRDLDG
jgi:hypothetical protein